MKIKTLLKFLMGLLFAGSVVFTATAQQVIKFATEATYPPFESVAADGKLQGFDVSIVNALCAQMKAQCTISNQPWDSLIPSLQIGKFDALIGAMAITDARKKVVNFTKPYYFNTVSLVAAKSANIPTNPKSLQGKTIGVQGGTTFEQYMQAKYGKTVTVKTYASLENALLDLSSGRIDGVMGDTPMLKQWLAKEPKGIYVLPIDSMQDVKFFGDGDGIAVNKDNPKLLQALNDALDAIKANGTYDKIMQQYFPK